MIEIKTVIIIAAIYYISWLIAQYDKFDGISVGYRDESAFWRALVWISWFLMPLVLPFFVVLHLVIELAKKAKRVYEDHQRCKYSLNSYKTQRKYQKSQRK